MESYILGIVHLASQNSCRAEAELDAMDKLGGSVLKICSHGLKMSHLGGEKCI